MTVHIRGNITVPALPLVIIAVMIMITIVMGEFRGKSSDDITIGNSYSYVIPIYIRTATWGNLQGIPMGRLVS